jgi:tricorn protease
MYDIKEEKETSLMKGLNGFQLSADGKKMMVVKNGQYFITDAGPGAKLDKPVNTSGLKAFIDPRTEWRMVVRDIWRIYRDYFYDPNMHGVDWEAIGKRYIELVDHATCRDDVTYIVGEMIGELNVSHSYYWMWPQDVGPSVSVGLLGCDFNLAEDANGDRAWRISNIVRGGEWDSDAMGPLSQPGVDVNEGDFLLAINGIEVDTGLEPWAALQDLAGKAVTLTVSTKATIDDEARDVLVKPVGSENDLRYRQWVESNRSYVYEKTGGRVGYIYLPNTGIQGQNELMRGFIPQFRMDALIIDERWNGGGQIPTRFIELLNRPIENYFARHEGKPYRYPTVAHAGPKVMLINQDAGSGGDMLPYLFRQQGLGKLIGTRTWGGLVGLSGNPMAIDGSYATVPNIAFYEVDGTWGIEGYGVAPDIEVPIDPSAEARGHDPQLDKAIEVILAELEEEPWVDPDVPPYPDRSGVGTEPEDR